MPRRGHIPPMPRLCETCGASFFAYPYRIAKGQSRYCSLACVAEAQRRGQVSRTCATCGQVFTVKRSQHTQRYCSRACRGVSERLPLSDRFWSHVEKTDTCWLWTGAGGRRGYGFLNLDGRPYPAHRLAYELTYGLLLPGIWCLHHCDNPPCVRPDHLFLGTRGDNVRDMVAKQRHWAAVHPERVLRGAMHHSARHPELRPRGEAHARATLTNALVREIRRLYSEAHVSKSGIARGLGISRSCVQHVLAERTWRHVVSDS